MPDWLVLDVSADSGDGGEYWGEAGVPPTWSSCVEVVM